MRTLTLSWEYPPVIEGGLGRHVRKLSENLVGEGVEVHVLTRGPSSGSRFRLVVGCAITRRLAASGRA